MYVQVILGYGLDPFTTLKKSTTLRYLRTGFLKLFWCTFAHSWSLNSLRTTIMYSNNKYILSYNNNHLTLVPQDGFWLPHKKQGNVFVTVHTEIKLLEVIQTYHIWDGKSWGTGPDWPQSWWWGSHSQRRSPPSHRNDSPPNRTTTGGTN